MICWNHVCCGCLTACLPALSKFPERLSVGLITAVYKSGDKSDMNNYRGITVGSMIVKLVAMMLDQRIATWAENHDVKAKGQAGFSKDFRTTDNIFVLRTLIDQRQTRQNGRCGKLYCCFVDFKMAFDMVNCDLLCQVLEGLGIHGRILEIIMSLYANDSAAVRSQLGKRASQPSSDASSESSKGACSAQPSLGCLWMAWKSTCLRHPTLMHQYSSEPLVLLLLYAGDLVLKSTTAAGLQQQLHALASFCKARELTVNLSKTKGKIVIFEARRSASVDFILHGNVVERQDHDCYLDFTFHATKNQA